jgi:hypothetical protein
LKASIFWRVWQPAHRNPALDFAGAGYYTFESLEASIFWRVWQPADRKPALDFAGAVSIFLGFFEAETFWEQGSQQAETPRRILLALGTISWNCLRQVNSEEFSSFKSP